MTTVRKSRNKLTNQKSLVLCQKVIHKGEKKGKKKEETQQANPIQALGVGGNKELTIHREVFSKRRKTIRKYLSIKTKKDFKHK